MNTENPEAYYNYDDTLSLLHPQLIINAKSYKIRAYPSKL